MALLNNPYIIDIIIGLFLIIYTFIGYLKGFIIRLYDFFSLFIAYFLTINFSFPLSKLIILYQLEGLLEPIGIKVNQLLVAVILFIVIYFLLKGIGVLLKPFLKKIVSFLKMTKLLDRLLGLILSIIEGIIIVYFVISMIFIPFINLTSSLFLTEFYSRRQIPVLPVEQLGPDGLALSFGKLGSHLICQPRRIVPVTGHTHQVVETVALQ